MLNYLLYVKRLLVLNIFLGAGGGWDMYRGLVAPEHQKLMGASLLSGGRGGKACYESTDGKGNGGFGGGGGGCISGGGGGGYAGRIFFLYKKCFLLLNKILMWIYTVSGGNALYNPNTTNGEGGYSFIDPSLTIPRFSMARSGQHAGAGMVIIIPAVDGCDCDYRCLAMDVRRSQVTCICPKGWIVGENDKSCIRKLYLN